MYLNLVHRLARSILLKEVRPDIAAVASHDSIHNWSALCHQLLIELQFLHPYTSIPPSKLIELQIQASMNFKPSVAGSSKQPENDIKNNTMTEQELKNKLFNEVILKNEIKETLIQFVRWRTQIYKQQKSRSLSDVFAENFQ